MLQSTCALSSPLTDNELTFHLLQISVHLNFHTDFTTNFEVFQSHSYFEVEEIIMEPKVHPS